MGNIIRWEYQRDALRLYNRYWDGIHRKERSASQQRWRKTHPEAARQQNRIDQARWRARQRAIRKAMAESKQSGNAD